MRKNTKAILVFLCALVMVLTGIGMPVASAAGTSSIVVDDIFAGLGDALNYGTVAREWTQNVHAESSFCVDEMYRETNTEFGNTGNTHGHTYAYELTAEVSAPSSLQGMTFALYKKVADKELGEKYVLCSGTEKTIPADAGNSTVLTWQINAELSNDRLYVFQQKTDGSIVTEGSENDGGLVVNYGPSVAPSVPNEYFFGKIVYTVNSESYTKDDLFGFLGTPDHVPSVTLGKDVKLYVEQWNPDEQKNVMVPFDPKNPSKNNTVVYIGVYRGKGNDELEEFQMKFLDYKDGGFYRNGYPVEVKLSDYSGVADKLVSQAEGYSRELAALGGGEVRTDVTLPSPEGSSTVTGPADAEGRVVSVYDVETTDWDFNWAADAGFKGLPVADNEYVVINVICPDRVNPTDMPLKMNGKEMFITEAEPGKLLEPGWGTTQDYGASQRVIYNFVYKDANGILQPFEGTVVPNSKHGGTLLVPKGNVLLNNEHHNGGIIADSVRNEQEIHQRTMKQGGRSTWVVMDGGSLILEKVGAEIDYNNYFVSGYEELDALEGAVFGVYSDEKCTKMVAEITTDEKGKATSPLLPAGDYWVKEIKAPDGYAIPNADYWNSNDPVKVTVTATEVATVAGPGFTWWQGMGPGGQVVTESEGKFVNQKSDTQYGDLRVEKLVSDTREPLQGVEFGIYTSVWQPDYYGGSWKPGDLFATITTNRYGAAAYYHLPIYSWGNNQQPYFVKELSAPDGYTITNKDYVEVYLKAGQMVTVDGNGDADGVAFLNDAIRGNIALKKVDAANGEPLEGAVFTVYSDKECTKVVGEMVTGNDGVATSVGIDKGKDLLPGTYYVVETEAPEDYAAPVDQQGKPIVYTVTVQYGKTVNVLEDDEGNPVAITNEQVVSFYGTKVWKDEGYTNQRPNEIRVNLLKNQDTNPYRSVVVSADTDWKFAFENLPRFEKGEEITYTIKEDLAGKVNDYHSYVGTPDEDGNLTIVNSIKRTKLVVMKVWEDELENIQRPNQVTYLLFQKVGDTLEMVPGMNGEPQMKSDAYAYNGYRAEFTNLPNYNRLGDPAEYVVKEAESDDFALIGDPVIEKNKNNQNANEFNYTLTNRLTVPLKGTKTWVDSSNADGKRPEDIELHVFCKDDEKPDGKRKVYPDGPDAIDGIEIIWDKETNPDVWSWKVIGLPKYDEAGNECSYTVNEVRVPGYKVTVSDDGLNFTNTKTGNLELYKVAPSFNGQQPLRGAEFKLYYDLECKNPVPGQEKTTDHRGFADFRDLAPGDYYLKEEKAPDFYELMAPNPLKVTVLAGKTVRVNGEDGVIVDNWFGTSTEVTLPVTKELQTAHYQIDVPEDLSKTFEFAIEADEATAKVTGWDILKDKAAVTVTGTGSVTTPDKDAFSIKFTQVGTYTFEVKETTPGTGNIKADDTVYTVTYTVTAGLYGRLHAEETIYKNKAEAYRVHFVNTYGYVDIEGDKVWQDRDDSLRLRIDKDTFKADYLKLFIDGEENPVTAAQLEQWGAKFDLSYVEDGYYDSETDKTYDTYWWSYTNLPAYDENGEMITYVVKEMTVKGYQTFYVNGGYAAVEEKNDGIYADAVPPSSPSPNVIFNALAKGTLTIEKTVEVKGDVQPDTLPKFQFTITPAEGLTGYHFMDAQGKELTSPVTVAVEKKADGTITGILPVTILFDSFDGTEKEFTFIVKETGTAPDGWTYDATEQTVTFTVMRNQSAFEPSDSLTMSQPVVVAMDSTSGGTASFTNTYKEVEKTDVTVSKYWYHEGNSNAANIDEDVTDALTLYIKKADGSEAVVTAADGKPLRPDTKQDVFVDGVKEHTEYTWNGLPILPDGDEYIVREDTNKLPYGYTVQYSNSALDYTTDGHGLDNRYFSAGASFVASKYVDGKSATKAFEFQLVDKATDKVLQTKENNVAPVMIDGTLLQIPTMVVFTLNYDGPEHMGKEYEYVIREVGGVDGYICDTTEYQVKVAIGDDGRTTHYLWDEKAQQYVELTVQDMLENNKLTFNNKTATSVFIAKHWANANFESADEVPNIADKLTLCKLVNGNPVKVENAPMPAHEATDAHRSVYTWSGLLKYDENGNEIEYVVVEQKMDGYFVEYSGSTSTYAQNGGTITNRVAKNEFFFHKWFSVEPEVDEAEIPESFRFIITPGAQYDGVVLMHKSVDDNEDAALTKLDANDDGEYIIDVQPKLEPEFGNETWDQYNADHLVKLIFTKAGEYTFTVKELVPSPLPDNWVYDTHSVSFKFTVSETGIVAPANPVADQPMDEGQEDMFYNELFNDCDLKITKIWENDDAKTRPVKPEEFSKYLTLRYAEVNDEKGEPISLDNLAWITKDVAPEVKVINEDEWVVTYKDLPKYIGGKEVTWSVVEKDIPGYTKDYDLDDEEGDSEHWAYDRITNTLELTSVSVTKEWVGGEYDGTNEPVTLTLYANDAVVDAKPDVSDNVYTWSNLAKYDTNGELIAYTVKETTVPDGYTVTYLNEVGEDAGELVPSDAACDGGTIVNTYEETVYEAKGNIVLEGTKVLEGRALKAGEFTFEVKDASDKVVATGTNDAAGKITFTEIKYTEKDAGKTYTYEVYEVKGNLSGVTYVKEPVTVKVTVTDNGDGTLDVKADKTKAEIEFVNTYEAEGAVTFKGAKFLLGREFKQGDEFTFELLNEKGDVIDTVTIKPTSGTKADFAFKTIKYELADAGKTYTYTYRVKEKAGTEDGMTYDDTIHTVTVKVSDAGDGTLQVEASKTADELNFTNTYLAEGSVLFSGTKTMNGKALEGKDFTFVLTDADGKEIETVTNDKDGKIVFSAIQYKLEDAGKTFTYKVSEKNDGKKAVTYDDTVYTVTVKVEDAGDGHLKVTASDNATKLNFTNSYEAKAYLTLNAFKTVNGYKPTADQVYDFVLLCDDGTEMNAQNKDENIIFGTLTFNEDDIGKTFIYTVKETTEANELLEVDTAIYQVAVTVVDNGDGNLKLETEFLKDGKRANGVVFANTATATLAISKTVKGPGPDKAFDLKVTFIGVDGKELEGVYDYDGDVKGTITSGGVIALKDGQSVTIVGLPEGATYTVEENAGPAYTVTVNGKPIAKAEGTLVGHGKLEFINTVEVTTFSVTKVWEGTDLGEITLTLYADGKQITPQPEVTREGDKYTYYNLPKYNEEGEEIVYSAKERGIDGYIRIYNNVEPYQDVTSSVHDGGTIINREIQEEVHELSFKIHKVWTGVEATEEIPAITLTLYCNGEKLDVPTPKPDSEGWYRYYDLPKTVNGQIAVYTVVEEPIPGYTVTYKTASGEVVEEGVNGGEIINAKIPQTGDPATLGLWLALMGASAVLLTMLQRRRKA